MKKRNKQKNVTIIDLANGGKRVYYWQNDKRISQDFKPSKLLEATEFYRARKNENILPEELVVSADDRYFLSQVKKFGPLEDVLVYLNNNYDPHIKSITLENAQIKYRSELEALGRRAITLRDYRIFFARTQNWKNKMLSDIDENIAREIINQKYQLKRRAKGSSKPGTNVVAEKQYSVYNKLKFAKAMSALWVWAIDLKLAKTNPFEILTKKARTIDKKAVKIFSNNQTRAFMQALDKEYRPIFALLFYAGIRPYEILNEEEGTALKWENIDFNKKQIVIDFTKTRKFRRISITAPILWQELERVPKSKRKGNIPKLLTPKIIKRKNSEDIIISDISETMIARARRNACRNAKLKWIKDIPRHSFASHAWHKYGPAITVEILGQESGFSILEKHYKALTTPQESEEYFKCLP